MIEDHNSLKMKSLVQTEIEAINTDNTVIQNQDENANIEINSSDEAKLFNFHTPVPLGRRHTTRVSQRYKDQFDLNNNLLANLQRRQDTLESENLKLKERVVDLEKRLANPKASSNVTTLITRIESLEQQVAELLKPSSQQDRQTVRSLQRTPKNLTSVKCIEDAVTPKKPNLANVIKGLKAQLEQRSQALKSLTGFPRTHHNS